jgi:hypothetical protein
LRSIRLDVEGSEEALQHRDPVDLVAVEGGGEAHDRTLLHAPRDKDRDGFWLAEAVLGHVQANAVDLPWRQAVEVQVVQVDDGGQSMISFMRALSLTRDAKRRRRNLPFWVTRRVAMWSMARVLSTVCT